MIYFIQQQTEYYKEQSRKLREANKEVDRIKFQIRMTYPNGKLRQLIDGLNALVKHLDRAYKYRPKIKFQRGCPEPWPEQDYPNEWIRPDFSAINPSASLNVGD